ncbi:hypothetical protein F2P79_018079, partial [Pimephales promelas]
NELLTAVPPKNETLRYPGISVSSDHLVTSRCANLSYEIICETPSHYEQRINYTVRNETTMTTNSDQLWWLLVLFISIIIIIISFIKRKRIFRGKRSICLSDDDTDNRDTYLKEKRKETEKRSGSAAGSGKGWKFSQILGSLDPFVTPRETSSNMEGVEARIGEYNHLEDQGHQL